MWGGLWKRIVRPRQTHKKRRQRIKLEIAELCRAMVTIILWLAMVIGIIIFPLFFSDYVQWAELEFGRIERGRQKSLLVVEVDQSIIQKHLVGFLDEK